MKYATINSAGTVEIRQDALDCLPDGAILLTDDQHAAMREGKMILVDGAIIDNPAPPQAFLAANPDVQVIL